MKINGNGTRIKSKKKELNNLSTRFLNNKDKSLYNTNNRFFDEKIYNDLMNIIHTKLLIDFLKKLEEKCIFCINDFLIKNPTITIHFIPKLNKDIFNFNIDKKTSPWI